MSSLPSVVVIVNVIRSECMTSTCTKEVRVKSIVEHVKTVGGRTFWEKSCRSCSTTRLTTDNSRSFFTLLETRGNDKASLALRKVETIQLISFRSNMLCSIRYFSPNRFEEHTRNDTA